MKKITILMLAVCGIFAVLKTAHAQDDERHFLIISYKTIMPDGGSAAERDSLESIFTEAVIRKNDKILSQQSMQHYYGPDSRDWIVVRECASWADLDAARLENRKLSRETWPDRPEREAFFKELNKYWLPMHGDEIYVGLDKFEKHATQMPSADENHIFTMNTTKITRPDGGSVARRDSLLTLEHEAITMKNDKIISQRILTHRYGSDRRDWITVTEYAKWEDIAEAATMSRNLRRERWPDEAERSALRDEVDSYFLLQHSDQIYTGLSKFEKRPALMTAK